MKRINLALQGGGAHGAFTWGVLDRILEEDDIEIAAISGTSAGAMNGAALKAGLVEGGSRQAARDNLDWLWEQMGAITDPGMEAWMAAFLPDSGIMSKLIENSPFFAMSDAASRMFSPYMTGPFYDNPLRRIAERFHYDAVCADAGPVFFVCATNVRTGRLCLFSGHDITTESLLASACLPTMFKAIEVIDPETGNPETFWDGGYTGNPALFPMFGPEFPNDIVVVNINPLERREVPTTPHDIQNRINEIGFNRSLLSELRAIHFVRGLIDEGKVIKGTMKDVMIHMIADDVLMNSLSIATKMVPTAQVLNEMKLAGRQAAGRFLDEHKDKLGVTGTADLQAMFG